ncbi:MAG: di-heme-cytochrome C peroxidase [Candidatus Binatia bacterium]
MIGIACLLGACASDLPDRKPVDRIVSLDQGWTAEQRDWFHHASQGTATLSVPYPWFVALEQPVLSLGDPPLLAAPENLARYGFLSSPVSIHNPDGLPVGFARDQAQVDPRTQETLDAVGFTCAACHTGQIEYRGTAIRIEGGPAATDLGKFRHDLKWAIAYTKLVPGRFKRFARRVLGASYSEEAERQLKEQFDAVVAAGREKGAIEEKGDVGIEEGFGRLDALGRIANLVFGVELDPHNVAPLIAPVAYPHIWDTPWFDWVQYNGSIRQPMARNAGEALGVGARVNLNGNSAARYRSTLRVENLHQMERLIAGDAPFAGLRAPRWPEDVLGPIDRERAERGRALYAEHCQVCHRPPVGSAELEDAAYWTEPNDAGERYLVVKMVDIDYVGTDPNQAETMVKRRIDLKRLGEGEQSFGDALGMIVERTVARWYDDRAVPAVERQRMNGNRPNDARAPMQYKARPLDGIWATPPYLHNGSVPDLYSLLLPGDQRPSLVHLWTREYDPKRVGYVNATHRYGTKIDTAQSGKGNSNRGHEFRDGPRGNGVIGPLLSEEQRWDLVEYLKTL